MNEIMGKTENIVLKLYKEGMLVYVNKKMSFDELKDTVVEKFKKSENFFKGLTLKVGFTGCDLSTDEINALVDAVSETLGCKAVLWENPDPIEMTTEEKLNHDLSSDQILSNAFKIDIADEKILKLAGGNIPQNQ